MSEFESKGQRFVALCMLGMLLFNYPILALFNVSGTLFGVPVLYAYLFIAWAALIDYAKMNEVDHILIGAPRNGAPARLFPGVSAQVVAEAPCSVTVVRPRPES